MTSDSLLITNKDNIYYLTGFLANYDREVFVLLSPKQNLFITDARIIELVKGSINKKFKIVERNHSYPLWQILLDFLKENRISKLNYEKNNLTVWELESSSKRLKGIKLIGTTDAIEKQRIIKTQKEIDLITKAAQITDKTFKEILPTINSTRTEKELVWKIKTIFNQFDAEPAFEPIIASGTGSSIPHYISQNKKIENNSLLLLDFGARYKGYCSDMTRVVFLGKPTTQLINIYNTVLKSNHETINYINKLISSNKKIQAKSVDKLARDIILKAGYPSIPHGVGHGVGIVIHENPRLNPKSNDTLSTNMVFTIEPGIYLSNIGGIRIEDLVVFEKNKVKVISKSSKEIIKL